MIRAGRQGLGQGGGQAVRRAVALILLLLAWAMPALAQTLPADQPSAGVHADGSGTIQRPSAAPDIGTGAGGTASATGQDSPASGSLSLGQAASLPTIGKNKGNGIDYAAWERAAQRAEDALAAGDAAQSPQLERLRTQLADWREALLGAENSNAARIATLRQQIDALGPAPAQGETEAAEIARRRAELSDQLVRLQAPGLAAEEAYRRADGLIQEIDRVLRLRQTDAMLKLWPSPVNPANWPEGVAALSQTAATLWTETSGRAADPVTRAAMVGSLPLILFYLVAAVLILARGRRMLDRLLALLRGPAGARAHRIFSFVASLGQVLVPVLGLMALSQALVLTGLLGPLGLAIFGDLGRLFFLAVAATWLAERAFPADDGGLGFRLTGDERRQLRWVAAGFGLVMVAARMRRILTDQLTLSDAAIALLNLPLLVVGGLLLWQTGRILSRKRAEAADDRGEDARLNYRDRILALLGRAAIVIGIAAPVLAAVGYNTAAQALVLPAARSLALIALLVLVQRFLADVAALVIAREGDADGLVPVLIGMVLTLAAAPALALIWGARVSDLTELWARFQEGFQLGATRISPTDFLVFLVIFGIGFTLTRFLQGAMKTSVLPRTRLDQGGQNAIVSGLGYLGIILSALVAIDSTGIDLSGLAIVAGALSVGIGFGLQTVVSNFVSGVILLVERPVSEGDWIEVGDTQGIVKAISVRATRIQTFDRSDVIVPNSDLITGKVTNWTRFNLTGRLILPVGVAYGSDTRQVERVLKEIAEAQPLVLLNPPPVVVLKGFGASAIEFEVRMILRDVNFSLQVRTEMNHQIAERFAAAGIEIPFAQTEVKLKDIDRIAQALARSQEG